MDLPLHPKIVHIPIALAVLMPLVTAGILVAWWRGWLHRRGWWMAVALQAIMVVGGFLAMRSGEGDEERVERVVNEAAIEEHEEAAELFTWVGAGVLVLMIGAGALRRDPLARGIAVAATAGTALVLWLGYKTGQAGGELVYKYGAGSAWAPGGLDVPAGTNRPVSQNDEDSDSD